MRTREQGLKPWRSMKTPRLAPSLTVFPDDVLAETSTRVCVESSVLVLMAAEPKKEMVNLLAGDRTLNASDDAAERTERRRV